jgi:hypothetical protein
MQTHPLARAHAIALPGLVLVALAALSLSGCTYLFGGQTRITGTVLGVSIPDREAGRTVVVAPAATVTCNGVSTQTASDGRYQLVVGAADQYVCSVAAPSYQLVRTTIAGSVGHAVTLNFAPSWTAACSMPHGATAMTCPGLQPPPGTLAGTVTDPESDQAAKNAKVECWEQDLAAYQNGHLPLAYTATTDAYGHFSLALPVNAYACAVNSNPTLFRTHVAPQTVTPADFQTCETTCPTFHNHLGLVMHTYTAYVIYWLPAGYHLEPGGYDARFESLVERYLTDIGGTPLYDVLTQYWDSEGPIVDSVSLGGTMVDTTPYPHRGTTADPVQDRDVQNEITRAIQTKGWIADTEHEFIVITGYGVQECSSIDVGAACSFAPSSDSYCGYHRSFDLTAGTAIYAYVDDIPECTDLSVISSYPSPNGDPIADSVINTVSHEQFESVSDPFGDAWYDDQGNHDEMADLCETDFGNIGPDGANVTLANGHRYIVQTEWSNLAQSCVLP